MKNYTLLFTLLVVAPLAFLFIKWNEFSIGALFTLGAVYYLIRTGTKEG